MKEKGGEKFNIHGWRKLRGKESEEKKLSRNKKETKGNEKKCEETDLSAETGEEDDEEDGEETTNKTDLKCIQAEEDGIDGREEGDLFEGDEEDASEVWLRRSAFMSFFSCINIYL